MSVNTSNVNVKIEKIKAHAKELLNKELYYYLEAQEENDVNKALVKRLATQKTLKKANLILAPTDSLRLYHEDAELAVSKAAQQLKIPYIISSYSSYSIEEIADSGDYSNLWFRLNGHPNTEINKQFIQRASLAGYQAIVLNLNSVASFSKVKWRLDGITNFIVDPIFQKLAFKNATKTWNDALETKALSWKDISYLDRFTQLPLYIEGAQTISDVEKAIEIGVKGIVLKDSEINNIDFVNYINQTKLETIIETNSSDQDYLLDLINSGFDHISIRSFYLYGLTTGGYQGTYDIINQIQNNIEPTLVGV